MYKILITYTVSGSVRSKRYVANGNSLANVLLSVNDRIKSYESVGVTFNECSIKPCSEAEVDQWGEDLINSVKNVLSSCPDILGVSRDNVSFAVTNAASTLYVYTNKYSSAVYRAKHALQDIYNTPEVKDDCKTVVKIVLNESPDLELPHLVLGVDYS